jgi:hypothetical protein
LAPSRFSNWQLGHLIAVQPAWIYASISKRENETRKHEKGENTKKDEIRRRRDVRVQDETSIKFGIRQSGRSSQPVRVKIDSRSPLMNTSSDFQIFYPKRISAVNPNEFAESRIQCRLTGFGFSYLVFG